MLIFMVVKVVRERIIDKSKGKCNEYRRKMVCTKCGHLDLWHKRRVEVACWLDFQK